MSAGIGAFCRVGAGECRTSLLWPRPQPSCTQRTMKRLVHIFTRHGLLALMILALLALPFVHRAGAAPVTPEMSQFIAMGGNLSDICGESGGHRAGGCESCLIADPVLLSSSPRMLHPGFGLSSLRSIPLRTAAPLPATPYTSPPARAPPQP